MIPHMILVKKVLKRIVSQSLFMVILGSPMLIVWSINN